MSKQNCAFEQWYKGDFAKKSIKSIIIPLPASFIAYLKEDGIALTANPEYTDTSSINSDSIFNDTESENDNIQLIQPSFPTLESQIDLAIKELGGVVFPKLNWSSPKDSAWIAFGGSLKCHSKDDIFLLLKASDFIQSDLEEIGNNDDLVNDGDYHLVLRKWVGLTPSLEFRCFVIDQKLVAITQRDYINYYPFLFDMKSEIMVCHIKKALIKKHTISSLFESIIKDKFPDPNYVFDAYINKSDKKPWIIDFNPSIPSTDTLLFSWEEIEEMKDFELRLVESQQEANFNSSHQPAYLHNRVPRESLELSNGESPIDYMRKLTESIQQSMNVDERMEKLTIED